MKNAPVNSTSVDLSPAALDRLMPLHLRMSADGVITAVGPTLAKLTVGDDLVGRSLFDAFVLKRPSGLHDIKDVLGRAGQRLHLTLRGKPDAPTLRGVAFSLNKGGGMLMNLSFGIGVIDAVRNFSLTDADFAPTDLTVEMLYLVEAKTAVLQELKNLNLRLHGAKVAAERQALTDTLTGLKNRRALDAAFGALMRAEIPFGLMHIDLDFFKVVNDTLGHAAGDHVLRAVAQILLRETRSSDTVARVGGDEFVLVFPTLTDQAVLGRIARRIIDGLTTPIEFEGENCRISASIGIALSTQYEVPEVERMSGDADEALYASKRAGRGRALFHTPTTGTQRTA